MRSWSKSPFLYDPRLGVQLRPNDKDLQIVGGYLAQNFVDWLLQHFIPAKAEVVGTQGTDGGAMAMLGSSSTYESLQFLNLPSKNEQDEKKDRENQSKLQHFAKGRHRLIFPVFAESNYLFLTSLLIWRLNQYMKTYTALIHFDDQRDQQYVLHRQLVMCCVLLTTSS